MSAEQDTLQRLINNDIEIYGKVTDDTREAITTQGYAYHVGQLERLSEQSEKILDVDRPELKKSLSPYYTINETPAR